MKQVVIENPVINFPYLESARHFKFADDGITDEIVEVRRISSYFIPVDKPKKEGKSARLCFETEWIKDRIEENKFVDQIRAKISQWRQGGYQEITKTTHSLLEYRTNPDREGKLFFCQIEAVETAIYITEAAKRYGDTRIENDIPFQMATGSGKNVVTAMLIAWHVLNKLANPQDPRLSDVFLIVTPGITIGGRLVSARDFPLSPWGGKWGSNTTMRPLQDMGSYVGMSLPLSLSTTQPIEGGSV